MRNGAVASAAAAPPPRLRCLTRTAAAPSPTLNCKPPSASPASWSPTPTCAECSRGGCRPLRRDRIRRVRSPRHPAAARPAGSREGHRDSTAGQGDVGGGEGLRRLRARRLRLRRRRRSEPRSRDARDCRRRRRRRSDRARRRRRRRRRHRPRRVCALVHTLLKGETLTETAAAAAAATTTRAIKSAATPEARSDQEEADAAVAAAAAANERAPRAGGARLSSQSLGSTVRRDASRTGGRRTAHASTSLTPSLSPATGSIAASDAPDVLWRAGAITDPAALAAARPTRPPRVRPHLLRTTGQPRR